MRERTLQDIAWNEQKDRSAEHNRLLADNVIYHGQFLRRTITAARALRAILRPVPSSSFISPVTIDRSIPE